MNVDRAVGGTGVSPGDVERVLADAFPGTAVRELSALGGEGRNPAFAVRTGDGERFVLKCASDEAGVADLRRELSVANYVRRETDVPAVEPVAHSVDGSAGALPYVVTRFAAGRTLEETLASLPGYAHPQVFSNVGSMLATLHAQTSFDAPGEITPTGPASFDVDAAASWPELFAGRLADTVESLRGTRFEAVAEGVWSYVVDRLRTLDTGDPSALLHGDVGEGNVTYDGAAVSRVLDWERALVGHPEFDLCRAEVRYFLNDWGRPSRLQATLYAGYREVRDLPSGFDARRRCYLATFFLLPLATYPEWAPALTDDLDGFAERLSEKIREIME